MFSLSPLGDLTRFQSISIKSEVYLVTEDLCIQSHGILLAARSAKIQEILEESENISVVELSDNMTGLQDCLDLIYGGSVDIREDNFKTIYRFGKLFEICEMMEGVLAWIANDLPCDQFWSVYFELENLHDDTSIFVDTIRGYLSTDGDNFVEHTTEVCRSQGKNTVAAVVELLFRIDSFRALSVMENIIDIVTEDNETPAGTASSTYTDNYLQEIVDSTVTYIENLLNIKSCDIIKKFYLIQSINKIFTVCKNTETLKRMIILLTDLNKIANAVISIKDLDRERVDQLSSPTTPFDAIKHFTEHARTRIHPCVVVEIILKWWSVRKDIKKKDMRFIRSLITAIENVSSNWYDSIIWDNRYYLLIQAVHTSRCTTARSTDMHYQIAMSYRVLDDNCNRRALKNCISKGDGAPAQLGHFSCTDNMERYRLSVPAFRYNAATFPPYGDTKHHWYIRTYDPFNHLSLITESKKKILYHIKNAKSLSLHFVPLPDTVP